jgi:hypothetical protein
MFIRISLLAVAAASTGQLVDLPKLSTNNRFELEAAGVDTFLSRPRYYHLPSALHHKWGQSRPCDFTFSASNFIDGNHFIGRGSLNNHIYRHSDSYVGSDGFFILQQSHNGGGVWASRLAKGYVFGLTTTLAFRFSPLLIRGASGDTGLGVAVTLLAYMPAIIPLLFPLVWPSRRANIQLLDQAALKWCLLSGVTAFRFIAFNLAPVTVIEPLMITVAMWTVIFAYLINRRL